MSILTEDGKELFDQTPVSIPVHFDRPTPLHIRIRNQILALMQEQSQDNEP